LPLNGAIPVFKENKMLVKAIKRIWTGKKYVEPGMVFEPTGYEEKYLKACEGDFRVLNDAEAREYLHPAPKVEIKPEPVMVADETSKKAGK
jgi:DNA modification methylase